MYLTYNLLLFVITLAGGAATLYFRKLNDERIHYLLTFSGSFLLTITFLHLLPESFRQQNQHTGLLLLAGFFIQLLIQRITHGMEHGHSHIDEPEHHFAMIPLITGLSIHALMEGIPLGFPYTNMATGTSLYMAIAAHKLPETMLATSLVVHMSGFKKGVLFLLLFSLATPISSMVTNILSTQYRMGGIVNSLLPLVAGAFIHIATTIFYESGTKKHLLSVTKVFYIISGLVIGLLTLLFE